MRLSTICTHSIVSATAFCSTLRACMCVRAANDVFIPLLFVRSNSGSCFCFNFYCHSLRLRPMILLSAKLRSIHSEELPLAAAAIERNFVIASLRIAGNRKTGSLILLFAFFYYQLSQLFTFCRNCLVPI